MRQYVSHDRSEETLIAKARWYASLPDEQKFSLLCDIYEFVAENNPKVLRKQRAPAFTRNICVLERP